VMVPRLVALETSGLNASSIFFTDGSKGGRVPVLVYIIIHLVECLFRRFQRFLWL
jgi:hypothetical protein